VAKAVAKCDLDKLHMNRVWTHHASAKQRLCSFLKQQCVCRGRERTSYASTGSV